MAKTKDRPAAAVLGMFETGLAVGRSLGRHGIPVFGIDYKKDIGSYSRYIIFRQCPHPLKQEKEFVEFMTDFGKKQSKQPILFVTADDFLLAVSRNRDRLSGYFSMNFPKKNLVDSIFDKYQQYLLAEGVGIPVPKTFQLKTRGDLQKIMEYGRYPLFLKGLDVNNWRRVFGGSRKGFVIHSREDLKQLHAKLSERNVTAVVQELITGEDTSHYKYCTYISKNSEVLLKYTLRKIRQNPIHFGVGSVVESVHFPQLEEVGYKLFTSIGFQGIGSAEFKIDSRDGQLKLIEINPRYWQQNAQADACGMNFPLIHYRDENNENPAKIEGFVDKVKWINIYMDINSFIKYKKEKKINLSLWLQSLRGEKIFSDFAWDDIVPFFYEVRFGKKFLTCPIRWLGGLL